MQRLSINPNVIRTFTGQEIDPLNPAPEQINIVDIAHALSQIPRFGGHSQRFYSVAEHSLHAYEEARKAFAGDFELQLTALMHDASEAYLLDVPTPVKHRMIGYHQAEYRLMAMIGDKFGFPFPLNGIITSIDRFCLRLEWQSYMVVGSGAIMHPEPFNAVKNRFLKVFDLLTNKI